MQPLPANEKQVKSLKDFARYIIAPGAMQRDRLQYIDEELRQQLVAAGLMSIEIDQHYYKGNSLSINGAGCNFSGLVRTIEEVSKVDAGISVYLHVHNVLVVRILMKYGSEEQKQKWLPKLASSIAGAFAVTEAEGGSDLSNMTVTAVKTPGGYLINGEKRWITNAKEAGLFITFAKLKIATGQSVATAFLVDADSSGLSVSGSIDKMSMRASSTCNVAFANVFVADDCLLASEKSGVDITNYGLCMGRIGIAAQMLGIAQTAVDQAIAYAAKRQAFGKAICQYQGVSFPVAQCLTEIDILHPFIYQLAEKVDAGISYIKIIDDANKAKLFASQVAERATSMALEILGGNGIAEEYGIEKLYRDAKVGKIYEGTVNILLRSIASRAFQIGC